MLFKDQFKVGELQTVSHHLVERVLQLRLLGVFRAAEEDEDEDEEDGRTAQLDRPWS